MRLKDLTGSQQRLLQELTGRISNRLEAEFSELSDADGPNVGIRLRERNRSTLMELPGQLLLHAGADATAREAVRVRIKATRDRMLFRVHPSPLSKHIAVTPDPGGGRLGRGGGNNRRSWR